MGTGKGSLKGWKVIKLNSHDLNPTRKGNQVRPTISISGRFWQNELNVSPTPGCPERGSARPENQLQGAVTVNGTGGLPVCPPDHPTG